MTARRRVEYVFQLYAMGAGIREDPPLRTYVLGQHRAVVINLPTHLTFRPGGRPRFAHALPDSLVERLAGFTLERCPDLDGPLGYEENWWFKKDPRHCRQREECCCDERPAWGVIECPIHGTVSAG